MLNEGSAIRGLGSSSASLPPAVRPEQPIQEIAKHLASCSFSCKDFIEAVRKRVVARLRLLPSLVVEAGR
ncbi:hypothetical protein PHISCL_10504 [Aspergillus sclerotialis]|uniref:Uncharacterized protein n=1 Tax=Aspergillus sclerotialis TaxID=2070753 RepID=A0A3A2Z331_9EURO|nr:hypothetical protein PHISCL_10504 [Aspergillus sclerotialis]